MNTANLRYVVEVNRVRSITKAAQNLYMGQPNLSKAIKELESELGLTIFKRTAKGVVPTPKGEEFLSYAQSILSQLDELESLYKPSPQETLSLNVAIPRASYVAAAFADFLNSRMESERVDVNFRETGAINTVSLVADGEMDFGIIRYQTLYEDYFRTLLRQKGLESELLWEFNLQVMLSDRHPLAALPVIPYHKLAGYIELVHGDYQVPSLAFSQIKKSAELEAPRRRITIYDRGSQFDLLQRVEGTYLWVSPVPEEVLLEHHVVLRPCPLSAVLNRDALLYQKGKPLSSDSKKLMDAFRKTVASYQNEPDTVRFSTKNG